MVVKGVWGEEVPGSLASGTFEGRGCGWGPGESSGRFFDGVKNLDLSSNFEGVLGSGLAGSVAEEAEVLPKGKAVAPLRFS